MPKPDHGYPQMEVKLYSQFNVYFDGGAESVSALNKTGPFDILPGHANFFTLLTAGKIRVLSGGEPLEFNVSRGVAHVSGDTVRIFMDI